jgi:hypothetical protein
MKVILFYLLLTSSFSFFAQAQEPIAHESKMHSTDQVEASDDVAQIFQEVGNKELETPEVKPKSAFMVWLTSFGIKLLSVTPRPVRRFILKIAGKAE